MGIPFDPKFSDLQITRIASSYIMSTDNITTENGTAVTPKLAPRSKKTKKRPSGYRAVSGSSHSVATTRHNPLSVSPTNTANSSKDDEKTLFVFHLPDHIDDHALLELFAPYGAMKSNVM